MIIYKPTNELSKMLKGIHSSIDNYDSSLDEFSFATTYIVIVRINNNINNFLPVKDLDRVTDYLNITLKDFYNNYPEYLLKFMNEFDSHHKTDNETANNFIVGSAIMKPALKVASEISLDVEELVYEEYKYIAIGILLLNLLFAITVRLYQGNFKIMIPVIFKFINEYSWTIKSDKRLTLSKEYYKELLKSHTPIQKHTAPKKAEALMLAIKVWELDNEKVLLRKHVAEIITKLLPQHKLSITQVDNWLKQSDVVPPEILERYKNNDYGNSAPIVRERKKLIAEILLSLTPLYCESL